MFDDAIPVVRAISPLAEGTDRIFAESAVANEYELCCVMPFAQAEFEKDFAEGHALEPNSLERFRTLVGKAKTRFELDGCRAKQDDAYNAAGETVLNQSDLLVVVWDGERLGKRGGTEETMRSAVRQGVPVILIDTLAPQVVSRLRCPSVRIHQAHPSCLLPEGGTPSRDHRSWLRNVFAGTTTGRSTLKQSAGS